MWRFLILLTTFLSLHAAEPDQLTLLNGDSIHGKLLGLQRGRLEFALQGMDTPLFIPAKFSGWLLRDISLPGPPFINTRTLFSNGDVFYGQLLDITDDELRLKTPWGTEVKARLPFVEQIDLLPPPHAIPIPTLGFQSMWTVEHPRLFRETPEGFFLQAPNGLTRAFPAFPQRFRLDLRAESASPFAMLQLNLFSRRAANPEPDSVSIQFHSNMLMVTHFKNRGQDIILRRSLDHLPTPAIDFTLYGDLLNARFSLFFDGEEVAAWEIPDFRPGIKARGALSIWVPQFSHEFHSLQLRPWNGDFPHKNRPSLPLPAGAKQVRFRNGDFALFQEIRADSEHFSFVMPDARLLRVPMAQLDSIRFSQTGGLTPRRHNTDVQVSLLPHGNRITLALHSLDPAILRGEQEHWQGPLSIPADHVGRIRFNIYHPHRFDGRPQHLPSLLQAPQ